MKLRFVAPAAVFAILFAVFALMLYRTHSGDYDPRSIGTSPLLGKSAPQFQLAAVEDISKTVDSRSFKGKPYVINVWGTWCVACREEHSALLEIAKQNLVPIVGLDWNDDLQQARRWLGSLGNPYTATAFDGDGKVAINFGVYGAPETFLIDSNGIVQYKHTGAMTLGLWQREFVSRIQASNSP